MEALIAKFFDGLLRFHFHACGVNGCGDRERREIVGLRDCKEGNRGLRRIEDERVAIGDKFGEGDNK